MIHDCVDTRLDQILGNTLSADFHFSALLFVSSDSKANEAFQHGGKLTQLLHWQNKYCHARLNPSGRHHRWDGFIYENAPQGGVNLKYAIRSRSAGLWQCSPPHSWIIEHGLNENVSQISGLLPHDTVIYGERWLVASYRNSGHQGGLQDAGVSFASFLYLGRLWVGKRSTQCHNNGRCTRQIFFFFWCEICFPLVLTQHHMQWEWHSYLSSDIIIEFVSVWDWAAY